MASAPPSIGANVPLTYFGSVPSTVQRELVGPYQVLRSGIIQILLDEAAAKAGLLEIRPGKVRQRKRITPHLLRHSLSRWTLDAGIDYSLPSAARSLIFGHCGHLLIGLAEPPTQCLRKGGLRWVSEGLKAPITQDESLCSLTCRILQTALSLQA